jgi:hypothetical protein
MGDSSRTPIVTYVHRPKRPPRKRKAVVITGPAIVRKVKGAGVPRCGQQRLSGETHFALPDMLIRDILDRMRHDGRYAAA